VFRPLSQHGFLVQLAEKKLVRRIVGSRNFCFLIALALSGYLLTWHVWGAVCSDSTTITDSTLGQH
jgi:hypothetical protein